MATKKQDAEAREADAQQDDAATDDEAQGRVRGIEALSPTDRQSAELTDPRIRGTGGVQRGAATTAGEVAGFEKRTGSVLPYRVDGIDVDSFDVRTPEQIAAQREKDSKR